VEELKKLGVDRIQGFYYAKPMEEKAFCELLKMERE
jgi:EAL domain-containing protein (putative c-di-GMP-specific phosphodiesterase class I)